MEEKKETLEFLFKRISKLAILFIIAGGVICPGFLFLFVFARDLFILTTPKLLILSLAITTPIYLVIFIQTYLFLGSVKQGFTENGFDFFPTVTSFITIFVFCIPIFIHILRPLNINDSVKIIILCSFTITPLLLLSFISVTKRMKLLS
jgi:hypothetical protein